MIGAFIADDHPVVRQGLRQILAATEDIVVAGEARSGSELLEHLPQTSCDVVLLDLTMPGIDGMDILKILHRDFPQIPVLVLTMHSEDQFAVRTLRAGASGYLTKDSAPAELVGAIRRIVAGGRYISTWVAEKLAAHFGPDAEKPVHERLSDREYQVLRLVASGRSTRAIASTLSLSAKTVGTYRSRILEKMGMHTASELTAYAIRNRLVD
jgi:two-component system, NarL family, invasion response regulator UvrY